MMDDGTAKKVTAQVCAGDKMLTSVRKIAAKYNKVVYEDDGSFIENKTSGEKIWLKEDGNLWTLTMWGSKKGF